MTIGYAIYSSYHQGYWNKVTRKWTPWSKEASCFDFQREVEMYIQEQGWQNTTHAIPLGAYVSYLVD